MSPILTRAQMRAFDRYAIEACHVPGMILMENAGRGAAEIIASLALPNARIAIFIGSGNNGGDGLVVARHLLARGITVRVLCVAEKRRIVGDAHSNLAAWEGVGGSVDQLPTEGFAQPLADALGASDVVVDAIFGTGLDRPIVGHLQEMVRALNQASAIRVSLDIPSGLDADHGTPLGIAVRATHTITFGAFKTGMLTPSGAEHCGKIHVAGLGVPASAIFQHTGVQAYVIQTESVARTLRARPLSTHKFSAGSVAIVAGSAGKEGAAWLAGRGALRAGAGLVTVGSFIAPHRIFSPASEDLPEVMTETFSRSDVGASVRRVLEGKHAVGIGPGLGLDDDAKSLVNEVVLRWPGIKVVDADALTLFSGRAHELANAAGSLILTPHPGELGRLLGRTSAEVEADRFGAVERALELTRATIVLKGSRTIVASPAGGVFVCTAGNPCLATAGSGDVLTGVLAALACNIDVDDVARAGTLLHALAGDAWAARHGTDRGMLAREIADEIPSVMGSLLQATQA